MSKNVGIELWILCDDLGERVDDYLEQDRGTVSLFIDNTVLSANDACLAIISRTPETIDYLAIASAGRRGSDLERKVVLGPAHKLPSPITVAGVLEFIPPRVRHHIHRPERRVTRIPPVSGHNLRDALIASKALDRSVITSLTDILISRNRVKAAPLPDTVLFERDAVAISLETFGGSGVRQRYLGASPAAANAPFMRALEKSGVNILEDRMVDNDLAVFPGGTALKRHLVGAVTVSVDTGTLTIINANRTGIEKTLGVDLIYFHHSFNCFTMVQYKRMTGDSAPVYRPKSDSSYLAEISRMKDFLSTPPDQGAPDKPSSFRLGTNPFFFKLCDAHEERQHWSRMMQGMYLPLDLWERLVASQEAIGPRGALQSGMTMRIVVLTTRNS